LPKLIHDGMMRTAVPSAVPPPPSLPTTAPAPLASAPAAGWLAAVQRRLSAAEADRDTARAWLALVLDHALDVLVVADDQGLVVDLNAGAERLLGLERAQSRGRPLATLLRGLPAAPAIGDLAVPAVQVEAQAADGRSVLLEASVSSTRVGGRAYTCVIARDIGERLRTQDELLRRNIELQQFAYVASHDMRSPLRTVIGFLGLVLRQHGDALPGTSADLLTRSLRAAEHLDLLTADLLAYARFDAEPRPQAPVDLGEVLEDCRLNLAAEIESRGAIVEAAGLPVVRGNRGQLVQLLQNLLANALKYHAGHGAPCVRVAGWRAGGHWTVTVTDNGPGIPAGQRERVFEPFHRLHQQSQVPGTGLGLAICRKVVAAHGGRIVAEAAPEGGTMIVFTLACEEPDA
jgi:PAS domain S-box-containing protein